VKTEEFFKMIDVALICTMRTSDGSWFCHGERCEIKRGSVLGGEYGNGHTPQEAIRAYGHIVAGKLLVVDAYGSSRREYRVPMNLER
jgi:hypothetical protein